MSEARFGPFEPPVTLTDVEWAALDALRAERGLRGAAARLDMDERRLRVLLRNAAEKVRIVATL